MTDPKIPVYRNQGIPKQSQILLNRIKDHRKSRTLLPRILRHPNRILKSPQAPKNSRVVILGITFKENCPDTRNSKVYDIIKRLDEYGIKPFVVDPWADEDDALREYGVKLEKMEDIGDVDCVIVAVGHDEFKRLGLDSIKKLYKKGPDCEKVLIDVKGIYTINDLQNSQLRWWRL